MRFFYLLLLTTLLEQESIQAQILDDFSDGNFTANPAWSGDDAKFVISQGQLRSNANKLDVITSYYLSTPSTLAINAQWEFWINLKFGTSGINFVDVYLISDKADLKASGISGYFVRIGDTPDEISLYKSINGVSTKIIDGMDGLVNSSSNNIFKIKVARNKSNVWNLQYDDGATGSYTSAGSITDSEITSSSFFGIKITQSNAVSAANNHFFDDFSVTEIPPDITAPTLSKLEVIDPNKLKLTFSEPLEETSLENSLNYVIEGFAAGITPNQTSSSKAIVELSLSEALTKGQVYRLILNNLKDEAGNTIATNTSIDFGIGVSPLFHELLITEIMADPNPVQQLPDYEYLEIYNPTNKIIELQGCKLIDANASVNLPKAQLFPKEYVIICDNSSASELRKFGKVIELASFPSLTNAGEKLILKNASQGTVFSVFYQEKWYGESIKKEGGFSLEMLDVNNPCIIDNNWKASRDASGGTPGQLNSWQEILIDNSPLALLQADAINDSTLVLIFSKSLDSLSAVQGIYTLDNSLSVKSVQVQAPDFKKVFLRLSPKLITRTVYQLTNITQLTDCKGTPIASGSQAIFGLAEPADSTDIILNEILFNPQVNGVDFVEVLNSSQKFIDLKNWQLGGTNDQKEIDELKIISTENFILAPGAYLALTEDTTVLRNNYPKSLARKGKLFQVKTLPAFNDDQGGVVLLDSNKKIFEQFDYLEDYHFDLIDNKEGVSLERISPKALVNDVNSWFSAAGELGFATPGYANSQNRLEASGQGTLEVSPRVITPNAYGQGIDFTSISYRVGASGKVGSLKIFDSQGRLVRQLVQNQLLATEGVFTWDGTNDERQKLRTGYYVILLEVFDLQGSQQVYKQTIAVTEKF